MNSSNLHHRFAQKKVQMALTRRISQLFVGVFVLGTARVKALGCLKKKEEKYDKTPHCSNIFEQS